jgi:hypothetical protein
MILHLEHTCDSNNSGEGGDSSSLQKRKMSDMTSTGRESIRHLARKTFALISTKMRERVLR